MREGALRPVLIFKQKMKSMNSSYQTCPICKKQVDSNPQFPQYICYSCSENATDAVGEQVIFYHSKFNGKGYQGYYRRNNELVPFNGNTCYINGLKCRAMDDNLGGVVLQLHYETIELKNPQSRSVSVKQMNVQV